jgi:uncharacterized protein (DUF305 family)
MKYRIATLAVVAAGATVLSACGSSSTQGTQTPAGSTSVSASPVPAAKGAHNAADTAFATEMIPHHGQAIAMADMAVMKAANAEVKKLATQIKEAQDPEIATMNRWLEAWNEPVPSSSMGSMSGMSDMSHGMGMMSDADMTKLDKATGADFDRMWVTMMITHHQGAVTMAQTELASGQYAEAKTLAQSIITGQTAEIAQLKTLEKTLA